MQKIKNKTLDILVAIGKFLRIIPKNKPRHYHFKASANKMKMFNKQK